MDTQVVPHTHQVPVERRTNLLLRVHYDAAFVLLEPVLRNTELPIGTRLYRAMNQLQATYPSFNGNEIEAMVAAVMRTLQNQHKAAE